MRRVCPTQRRSGDPLALRAEHERCFSRSRIRSGTRQVQSDRDRIAPPGAKNCSFGFRLERDDERCACRTSPAAEGTTGSVAQLAAVTTENKPEAPVEVHLQIASVRSRSEAFALSVRLTSQYGGEFGSHKLRISETLAENQPTYRLMQFSPSVAKLKRSDGQPTLKEICYVTRWSKSQDQIANPRSTIRWSDSQNIPPKRELRGVKRHCLFPPLAKRTRNAYAQNRPRNRRPCGRGVR